MKIRSLIFFFSLFCTTTLSCKPFFTQEQLQTMYFFKTPSAFLNSPEKMAHVDLFAQQKKVFVKNMSDREDFAFLTLTDYKVACALFPLLVKQMGKDKNRQKAIVDFFATFHAHHRYTQKPYKASENRVVTTTAGDIHIFPQGTFPDYNSCTSVSRTSSALSLYTSCGSLSSDK